VISALGLRCCRNRAASTAVSRTSQGCGPRRPPDLELGARSRSPHSHRRRIKANLWHARTSRVPMDFPHNGRPADFLVGAGSCVSIVVPCQSPWTRCCTPPPPQRGSTFFSGCAAANRVTASTSRHLLPHDPGEEPGQLDRQRGLAARRGQFATICAIRVAHRARHGSVTFPCTSSDHRQPPATRATGETGPSAFTIAGAFF
jgi:hypothetical protein